MKCRWISRSPPCVPALSLRFRMGALSEIALDLSLPSTTAGLCTSPFYCFLRFRKYVVMASLYVQLYTRGLQPLVSSLAVLYIDITHAYIDPLNLGNNKYRYLRSVVQWYPFCTRTAAYHVSSCSLLFCVFSKPRGRYTDDGGINDKELIKVHASRVLPWVKDIVAGMDYLHRLAGYASHHVA